MEATKYIDRFTIEDNNVARRLAEEAISMCPENPVGYAQLSSVYLSDYRLGNTKSPQETLEKSYELAKKALAIDDSIPYAHIMLSIFYIYKREYDKAIAEGERAVALDPSGSSAYSTICLEPCSMQAGRRKPFQCSKKQSDSTPMRSIQYLLGLGHALRNAGRFEEAVSAYKKGFSVRLIISLPILAWRTTYSLMGREKEARAEAEEVLRINPKFSLDYFAKTSFSIRINQK